MDDNIQHQPPWQLMPFQPNSTATAAHDTVRRASSGLSNNYDINMTGFSDSSQLIEPSSAGQACEDSGYYELHPLASSRSVLQQNAIPDPLAKWNNFLHEWYINAGRKLPSDEELLFFRGLTKAPERSIRARFFEYYQLDTITEQDLFGHQGMNQEALLPQTFGNVRSEYDSPVIALRPPSAIEEEQRSAQQSALPLPPSPYRDGSHATEAPSTPRAGPVRRRPDKQAILTRSLRSLVWKIHQHRKKTGCERKRIPSNKQPKGIYQCTLGCGRRFRYPRDLRRHENIVHMQELWFCTRCGDPKDASHKHLYLREDKFREHMRKYHADWLNTGGLAHCRLAQSPIPMPQRCGFCGRDRFRAQSWTHRCEHIASHFRKGVTMNAWRQWAEDNVEEDDDIDDPCTEQADPGDEDDDNDSDSDDSDDENEEREGGKGGDYRDPRDDALPSGPSSGGDGDGPSGQDYTLHNFSSLWTPPAFHDHPSSVTVVSIPRPNEDETLTPSRQRLDILCQEPINQKGGTASVYKSRVRAHGVSDEGVLSEKNEPVIYAVKQYRKEHRSSFERELEAFSRLRHTHIIQCLATYTQKSPSGALHCLLFPVADYDLSDYMATKSPPVELKAIHNFWGGMLGIADALAYIHGRPPDSSEASQHIGYHMDIKPSNILRENGRWKLADFGFSEFVPIKGRTPVELKCNGGTAKYSAPECSRSSTETRHTWMPTKLDMWSFGCVLFMAATWVVLGPEGVRDYEQRRFMHAHHEGFPTFHDGKDVLPEISQWLDHLRNNLHSNDIITGNVLDLVKNHLLKSDPNDRLDSLELFERLHYILYDDQQQILMSDNRAATKSATFQLSRNVAARVRGLADMPGRGTSEILEMYSDGQFLPEGNSIALR